MRKRLNGRQRVALSIAIAVAAVIVGATVDAALWGGVHNLRTARGITSTYYLVRTVSPWAVGGLWLLVTAVATALIVRVLADPDADD